MAATINQHRPAAFVDAPADTTIRPILAERYKTKMCRNFIQQGMCPYESRCMFAHGEGELRTKEMNLQDGLVTEEAIRNFRRATMTSRADYQQHGQQYYGAPNYGNCYCEECAQQNQYYQIQQQRGDCFHYDPYAYNPCPQGTCDCEECRGAAAQTAPCQCPDCVPAVVQHQPYRSPAVATYKQSPHTYRRQPYVEANTTTTACQMP